MATADEDAAPGDSVWSRRLERGPRFSVALGWGPGQLVESFWRDVFRTTRPGSRLLELGCGSGDVSVWAAEAGRGLQIVASDVHEHPQGVRQHPDVAFVGGVRAEALPFPAAAFDLVISNFAIEYAGDREAAIGELARVLDPSGGAVLVMHSDDSVLTATSRRITQIQALLAQAEVPDRLHRAAALRPDHLSRRKLLKDLLKLRDELALPALRFSGVEYFDIAERLLKGDLAARQEIAQLDQGLAMRLEISRVQSRVAMDGQALARFTSQAGAKGLTMHTSELTCTYETSVTEKVGWIGIATKGAAVAS
jgi:SAM-dependent methyltransferase